MKKVFLILFFFIAAGASAQNWDVESARKEAFRNIQHKIDITAFSSQDPKYTENLQAIKQGRKRVENRFITGNTEGYIVSELDEEGNQKMSFFYDRSGHLLIVRLISKSDFPRTEYLYCAEKQCLPGNGKTYEKGDLMRVTFHAQPAELFYFTPNGKFEYKSP